MSSMKYSEFHRKIVKKGWKFVRVNGSHYFYEKDGITSPPIPFHGSNEIYELLRKAIEKQLGI